MITKKSNEFFVNGHHCVIQFRSRARYVGVLDGEEFTAGSRDIQVREDLIDSAKYMTEVEPDYWKVCRAVHNFLDQQTERDGTPIWVYNKTVTTAITPQDPVGIAYSALLDLADMGIVEEGRICMDMNAEKMWRAVPETDADLPDDYPDENPWAKYESK